VERKHTRHTTDDETVTFTSACLLFHSLFILDSHLHVWGDGKGAFPYASGQEPPDRLRDSSGPDTLLQEMDKAGVGGALIVQVCMHKPDVVTF